MEKYLYLKVKKFTIRVLPQQKFRIPAKNNLLFSTSSVKYKDIIA